MITNKIHKLLCKVSEDILKGMPYKSFAGVFLKQLPNKVSTTKQLSVDETVDVLFPFTDELNTLDKTLKSMKALKDNGIRADIGSLIDRGSVYISFQDTNRENVKKIIMEATSFISYPDRTDIYDELGYSDDADDFVQAVNLSIDYICDTDLSSESWVSRVTSKINRTNYEDYGVEKVSVKIEPTVIAEPLDDYSQFHDGFTFGVVLEIACTLRR